MTLSAFAYVAVHEASKTSFNATRSMDHGDAIADFTGDFKAKVVEARTRILEFDSRATAKRLVLKAYGVVMLAVFLSTLVSEGMTYHSWTFLSERVYADVAVDNFGHGTKAFDKFNVLASRPSSRNGAVSLVSSDQIRGVKHDPSVPLTDLPLLLRLPHALVARTALRSSP